MALNETMPDQGVQKVALFNDPKIRGWVIQALLILAVIYLFYVGIQNMFANLEAQNISSGFGFLNNNAGFAISQTLIEYSQASSTYGRVFMVGLLNTLLVAAIGVILATIIGFAVGIARLSSNFILRSVATSYVELLRNIPVLLQIFIWYFAVLRLLPGRREEPISLGPFGVLNVSGMFAPTPIMGEGAAFVFYAFVFGCIAAFLVARWSKKRQLATGQTFPVLWTALGLIIGLPLLIFLVLGAPVSFEYPTVGNFGPRGGSRLYPEFIGLLLALSTYTAAFIAEIVRSGILAIDKGQSEAASALGLRRGQLLRLVIIPQAMRVIVPPLTSQYLNLTKNSSLAVAIAYPDLVSVFAGTALNQTGQAVEVLLITMLTYLAISIITSALMNIYNRRVALVER